MASRYSIQATTNDHPPHPQRPVLHCPPARRPRRRRNAHPHSVDIAVGYFYLSGFALVADLLATRPGKVRILIGRTHRPTLAEISAG